MAENDPVRRPSGPLVLPTARDLPHSLESEQAVLGAILVEETAFDQVAAVEEGRVIFDNIKKFVKFSVAGNVGKIMVALLGPLPVFGLPLPLQPLQLLWLNLLTDGLLGLGMGVEPAERNVMQRPPARPSESIFAGGMVSYIALVGVLTGAVALAVGAAYFHSGSPYWQTMIFTVLCFSQIGQAFAIQVDQIEGAIGEALHHREMQRAQTPAIPRVHVRTLCQEQLDHRLVSGICGIMQGFAPRTALSCRRSLRYRHRAGAKLPP